MRLSTPVLAGLAAGALVAGSPGAARAFCGFYVSGAGSDLYNNATMVVLMRDGTRTVLSMQNNYEGPPSDFAMVVPVPVVLQEENVVTLPREVFDHVDRLAAPRLVEYWEQDPCNPNQYVVDGISFSGSTSLESTYAADDESDLGVKIEAQFTVGEYEVVILSAQDSTGLDTWLRRERYNIPKGAEPLLRPYVATGMKFFVAKVDTAKVQFQNGQAMLSPLRFHYDSEQFNLPVRLGLMNSKGVQDLLVHILAPNQRYEVANYGNVTIPTNIDVSDATRDQFGAFFAALLDEALARHPGSVVTEYAWDAASCDPCPTPPLEPSDLATLGADVIPSGAQAMVLTRLHARYSADALGEDLVFRAAPPIQGGREVYAGGGDKPQIERGAVESGVNNFQGRYIIRHPWTGPIACENPRRGVWGGPPGGGEPAATPAQNTAFAPRGQIALGAFVKGELGAGDYAASAADPGSKFTPSGIPARPKSGTCAGCSGGGASGLAAGALALFAALALSAVVRRRASRRR